jgi:hypothetical protein
VVSRFSQLVRYVIRSEIISSLSTTWLERPPYFSWGAIADYHTRQHDKQLIIATTTNIRIKQSNQKQYSLASLLSTLFNKGKLTELGLSPPPYLRVAPLRFKSTQSFLNFGPVRTRVLTCSQKTQLPLRVGTQASITRVGPVAMSTRSFSRPGFVTRLVFRLSLDLTWRMRNRVLGPRENLRV